MTELEEQIELSKKILLMTEEDWEGDDFVPYTQEVWERAVKLARHLVDKGYAVPHITMGPDGGIDLWASGYSYLVYVDPDPNQPIIYTDGYDNNDNAFPGF